MSWTRAVRTTWSSSARREAQVEAEPACEPGGSVHVGGEVGGRLLGELEQGSERDLHSIGAEARAIHGGSIGGRCATGASPFNRGGSAGQAPGRGPAPLKRHNPALPYARSTKNFREGARASCPGRAGFRPGRVACRRGRAGSRPGRRRGRANCNRRRSREEDRRLGSPPPGSPPGSPAGIRRRGCRRVPSGTAGLPPPWIWRAGSAGLAASGCVAGVSAARVSGPPPGLPAGAWIAAVWIAAAWVAAARSAARVAPRDWHLWPARAPASRLVLRPGSFEDRRPAPGMSLGAEWIAERRARCGRGGCLGLALRRECGRTSSPVRSARRLRARAARRSRRCPTPATHEPDRGHDPRCYRGSGRGLRAARPLREPPGVRRARRAGSAVRPAPPRVRSARHSLRRPPATQVRARPVGARPRCRPPRARRPSSSPARPRAPTAGTRPRPRRSSRAPPGTCCTRRGAPRAIRARRPSTGSPSWRRLISSCAVSQSSDVATTDATAPAVSAPFSFDRARQIS